jgi:hypothetical protein
MHTCNTTTSHPSLSIKHRWIGRWDLQANNTTWVMAMEEIPASRGFAYAQERRKKRDASWGMVARVEVPLHPLYLYRGIAAAKVPPPTHVGPASKGEEKSYP